MKFREILGENMNKVLARYAKLMVDGGKKQKISLLLLSHL
jgi:hypothetical protein